MSAPIGPDELQSSMPLWMQKFTLWSSLQKTCQAARGPNGIYCMWVGRNCGYEGCPRRIFEEVTVDPDSIKTPTPQPKFKNQIQSLQNENKQQRKQIADQQLQIAELVKRLEELEKIRN